MPRNEIEIFLRAAVREVEYRLVSLIDEVGKNHGKCTKNHLLLDFHNQQQPRTAKKGVIPYNDSFNCQSCVRVYSVGF